VTSVEIAVALLIALGLATTLVPVLPGTLIIAGALLVWATETGGSSWWFFAAALTVLAAGAITKYLLPGKGLKEAGIPFSTGAIGIALGIVGFFVIPVIGLFLGFVLGVYLAELRRLGRAEAWPSAVAALKAAGLSILIELTAGVIATGIWVAGLVTQR
jgi:uncharacterized protein YqgC (DUF456 family)